MILKLICIDEQHAQIAKDQFNSIGSRAVSAGRAVIVKTMSDSAYVKIKLGAMAYTDKVTNWDVEALNA